VEHPGLSGPGTPECTLELTPATPVALYGTTQNQEVGVWIAPAGRTTARLRERPSASRPGQAAGFLSFARSVVTRAVSSLPQGEQTRMAVRDLPEIAFIPP
jgi:hypothetical protein